MFFSDLCKLVRPHLSGDDNVEDFMRDIIAMLIDLPEKDWDTAKDPSHRVKQSTLRSFYNRGLSQKMAMQILKYPNKDGFIDSINYYERPITVRENLANDIKPFVNEEVNPDNVGEILFKLFNESLKYEVNPQKKNERTLLKARQDSLSYKGEMGSILLEDCRFACSSPGCGSSLQVTGDNNSGVPSYEIAKISFRKKSEYKNLLCLCHKCFDSYVIGHTKAKEKELEAVKDIQSSSRYSSNILSEIEIEKGITLIVENITAAKESDLIELNYNPTSVKGKIVGESNTMIRNLIEFYVAKYVNFVHKIMQNLSEQGKFKDELVRAQIKEKYKNLKNQKNKVSKEQIFNSLAEIIQKQTNQNIISCHIVVAYYVQSCEVFENENTR